VKDQPIPIISLFCGPGGMDLGFQQENFVPVLAIDDNQTAVAYNWNSARNVAVKKDIRELKSHEIVNLVNQLIPSVQPRGVIGGPPCQSFSIGNVRKKKGDPRARLAQEYARLLKALNEAFQLDFFVFENVLGLKTRKHRRRLALIRRDLNKAGFNLFEHKLDALEFGVPQKRSRFFVVGINKFKFPSLIFRFPEGSRKKTPTVRDVLADLPSPLFFNKGLKSYDIPFYLDSLIN